MAYDLFDLVHRRAAHGKQILDYFRLIDSVYIQRTEKRKVHDLTDVAVVAVLNRQKCAVAVTADDRVVRRLEVGAGHSRAVGKYFLRRDVRKCARNAAVSDSLPAYQSALIVFDMSIEL